MSKPLSLRQEQVLQATVHHYVDTMEPVGSRTLVQRFGIPASSATVRSAMGALERRGLLHQPHTSAGRVPSPMGYRHYVDALLPEPGVAVQHLERELTGLSLRWAGLDDLLMHVARRLTDFTGLMSLITQPQQENRQLETIRLVPSGDRLLVMLVEANGRASHLNLRLPHGAEAELTAMERWASDPARAGRPELGRTAQAAATQRRCAAQRPRPTRPHQLHTGGGAWPLQAGERTGI